VSANPKSPTGVGHLLEIAIRFQSRFAPSQTQTHFGSRDYEFPVAQASTEDRIPGPPYSILRMGPSLYPLRAILKERAVAVMENPFFSFRREGLPNRNCLSARIQNSGRVIRKAQARVSLERAETRVTSPT
jgi:hypothetical protein